MSERIFAGSDGGFVPAHLPNDNIGYTDGYPLVQGQEASAPPKDEKILGFTYGYMANRGEYRTPQGIKSQELLYELGVNWVCLGIANYQKTFYSTDIYADYSKTPTDRDITAFVQRAKSKGVKVCLKPMLNSEDNMWRAHIGFPDLNMSDMDIYWKKWFKSYTDYMLHYADLAQELECEMLCIGCEMLGTEHRKDDWLELIRKVREVYSGKIVYNTNHDHEDSVEWFDVLDYIGTSAYYPVGKYGTDVESMKKEWQEIKWRLDAIAKSRRKKYIFMEIGCRSVSEASIHPWDFTEELPWNEEEQANFYQSCMDIFMDDPNFAGVFWWDWSTYIYNDVKEAKEERGFNIHLKAAEQVVKDYYKQYK